MVERVDRDGLGETMIDAGEDEDKDDTENDNGGPTNIGGSDGYILSINEERARGRTHEFRRAIVRRGN